MDRLFEKGYILDPRGEVGCVYRGRASAGGEVVWGVVREEVGGLSRFCQFRKPLACPIYLQTHRCHRLNVRQCSFFIIRCADDGIYYL